MRKKTIDDYENLAKQRNHTLVSVSNKETPSQGDLRILCKDCGKEFTTTAKSYTNARKTGCIHCKAIKARNQTKSDKKTKQGATTNVDAGLSTEKALTQQSDKTSAKLVKRAQFQKDNNIYDHEGLVAYLKREPNAYNDFMLNALGQEKALLADPTKPTESHHIIPLHAGGSNAKWNKVRLTKEDHVKAHELRYKVYSEFGDYNLLLTKNFSGRDRVEPNEAYDALLLKQRQTANQRKRPKISGDDGSQASKAVLDGLTEEAKKAHRERHLNQMAPWLRDVLLNGATFYHARTETTFVLKPRQAPTLTELKDLLAAALPVGDVDRSRLEAAAKPANVTSAIRKMIKGEIGRPTAYGWKLVK